MTNTPSPITPSPTPQEPWGEISHIQFLKNFIPYGGHQGAIHLIQAGGELDLIISIKPPTGDTRYYPIHRGGYSTFQEASDYLDR